MRTFRGSGAEGILEDSLKLAAEMYTYLGTVRRLFTPDSLE